MASRLCARLAAMAAELALQEHPSLQELFSTVEGMISMNGMVHGTTGFLMYDDVAAHEYVVRVFGLMAGQISVDDVDAHYAHTVAAGANIVCEPPDRPYGIREYGVSDPEGQIWWFTAPLG
jgi:uncharacterized glyoxalase superfamily protein PhnB